jgi:uncharacterized protein YciI
VRDIRYIVLHAPGPNWKAGVAFSAQDGVQGHVAHFHQLLQDGKLHLGGPFLDERAGGMMIPAEGLAEAEIVAFAQADPAVVSGLLTVSVRPWLVGMQR